MFTPEQAVSDPWTSPPAWHAPQLTFLSISITTHIWNWRSDNFTIEIKFTIHLHTSILHSQLATKFVEAHLRRRLGWKRKLCTCWQNHTIGSFELQHVFATGMVASSSAFEGLSSVVQLVCQFLLWSVSRVPVIFEHARLVFVSFKRDSSARLCFGHFD